MYIYLTYLCVCIILLSFIVIWCTYVYTNVFFILPKLNGFPRYTLDSKHYTVLLVPILMYPVLDVNVIDSFHIQTLQELMERCNNVGETFADIADAIKDISREINNGRDPAWRLNRVVDIHNSAAMQINAMAPYFSGTRLADLHNNNPIMINAELMFIDVRCYIINS